MVFMCYVPQCKSKSKLHRLPYQHEQVYQRWIALIGRNDLKTMEPAKVYKNYRVCDSHFPEMKIDPAKYFSQSQLKKGACPILLEVTQDCEHSPLALSTTQALMIREEQIDLPISFGALPLSEAETSVLSSGIQQFQSSAPDSELVKSPQIVTKRQDLKKRINFLKSVGVTRASQLTPKAKHLYTVATRLRKIATSLQKEKTSVRDRLTNAIEFTESDHFFHRKVNKTTANFLLSQLKMQERKQKGRRYSTDDKIFALSLLKQSPKGYKLLQKVFALPSRTTLNKLLWKIPFHCGINKCIFNSLRNSITKLAQIDRYAIMMWDEISLEPTLSYNERDDIIEGFEDSGKPERPAKIADHAMVFMLRGIRRKWKQPVAYFFSESGMSAPDLCRNIKALVRASRDAGIKIVASVSDQLSINSSAIAALRQDTARWCARHNQENRSVGYLIDGEEIMHLFDTPHLLKCVRNSMLENNVKYMWKSNQYRVASWKDLIHLYEMDSLQDDDYRLCNRLTDQHIYKDKVKKMKVKYAAQVFSQRVSSIMRALGNRVDIDTPTSYMDTSDFVLFVDKLFDSLNGSSLHPMDGKTLRCAITDTSAHLPFFVEAVKVLESITFCSEKRPDFKTPTLKNWVTTLKAVKYLWGKLKTDGFKFLCPRNVNQDPLENFFGSVRSHGARNINPSPTAFKHSFKGLVVNNFTSSHSPGSNCEADESEGILNDLRHFITGHSSEEADIVPLHSSVPNEGFAFSETLNVLKEQVHSYLAGFIGRKMFTKITCPNCRSSILTAPTVQEQEIYFQNLVKWHISFCRGYAIKLEFNTN